MRNQKILFFYFLIGVGVSVACGPEPWKPGPQFQMTINLTNPVKAKRLTLRVRQHPSLNHCCQMFIHHRAGRFSELDYVDFGKVLRNPSDTVCLTRNEQNRLMTLLGQVSPEFHAEEIPAADEDFYTITVQDSTKNLHLKTFFNSDSPNGRLARFIWDLFMRYFPESPVRQTDAEVRLIRRASVADTILIRKQNDELVLEKNSKITALEEHAYFRLWMQLEANGVWALKTDTTYKAFYPHYALNVRLGLRSVAWEVAAPHLLADKRYDAIVHAIEHLVEQF